MAEVIDFEDKKAERSPDQWVWACNCDNASFRLYFDGTVECVNCGTHQVGIRAYKEDWV